MSDRRFVKAYIGWWEEDWINVLSAESQLAWIKFMERGKSHGIGGAVPKFSFQTVARQWLQGEESIRQMIRAAEMSGEVVDRGDHWLIVNWRRDQGDETGAERQRRFKERQKGNDGNALGNGGNAEERRGEEKRGDTPPMSPSRGKRERKKFVPPTPVEVAAYCTETGMPKSEGRKFFDHYTANGWKVGKNPMVDWKAAVRNWKSRLDENAPKGASYLDDIQEAS